MHIAKQSTLTRFAYDFLDADLRKVGALSWPDVAVATNARLKDVYPQFLNKKLQLEHGGRAFEIEFEYLNRDWVNDVRFTLMDGGTPRASADVTRTKRFFTRPSIQLTKPFDGAVMNKSGWFTLRYEVRRDDVAVGSIFEKKALTLTREIAIDLPSSIDAPTQFFLLFLVVNLAYR